MIKKIKNYIEQEPWDEWLLAQEKMIDNACIAVLVIAVLFFVPVCIGILARGGAPR